MKRPEAILSVLTAILLTGWVAHAFAQPTTLQPVFDGEIRVRSVQNGPTIVLARTTLTDSIPSRAFVGV
jgi:hypothetical protein